MNRWGWCCGWDRGVMDQVERPVIHRSETILSWWWFVVAVESSSLPDAVLESSTCDGNIWAVSQRKGRPLPATTIASHRPVSHRGSLFFMSNRKINIFKKLCLNDIEKKMSLGIKQHLECVTWWSPDLSSWPDSKMPAGSNDESNRWC